MPQPGIPCLSATCWRPCHFPDGAHTRDRRLLFPLANVTEYVLPLDQLHKVARQLLATTDPAEIEEKLGLVLRFAHVINVEWKFDAPLWRGRRCSSSAGYSSILEVGAPPAHLCGPGRLNEPGKPVLYVSTTQHSVFEELGLGDGEYVHLVGYSMQGNAIRTALLGEYTQVHRWGEASLGSNLGRELKRILRELDYEVAKSFLYSDAFLSSLVRDRRAADSEYLRSRVLSRLLFSKLSELNAITYPGIALDGAMNLAIQPSAASRLLTVGATCVVMVKRRYDYGIYDFEVVRWGSGHAADGLINWADRVPTLKRNRKSSLPSERDL